MMTSRPAGSFACSHSWHSLLRGMAAHCFKSIRDVRKVHVAHASNSSIWICALGTLAKTVFVGHFLPNKYRIWFMTLCFYRRFASAWCLMVSIDYRLLSGFCCSPPHLWSTKFRILECQHPLSMAQTLEYVVVNATRFRHLDSVIISHPPTHWIVGSLLCCDVLWVFPQPN